MNDDIIDVDDDGNVAGRIQAPLHRGKGFHARRVVRSRSGGGTAYVASSVGLYAYGVAMLVYAMLATAEVHLDQYFERATLMIVGWLVVPAAALVATLVSLILQRRRCARDAAHDSIARSQCSAGAYPRTVWDVEAWLAYAGVTYLVGAAQCVAHLSAYGLSSALPVDEPLGESRHLQSYVATQTALAALAMIGFVTSLDPIYSHLFDAYHTLSVRHITSHMSPLHMRAVPLRRASDAPTLASF